MLPTSGSSPKRPLPLMTSSKPARVKIGNVPWRFPQKIAPSNINGCPPFSSREIMGCLALFLAMWSMWSYLHSNKRFFLKASKAENRRQKIKGQKTIVLGIWDFESPLETFMSYSTSTKASAILLIAILVLVLLVIVQRMWFFSHKKLWFMRQVR